jgi:hypothetical protein
MDVTEFRKFARAAVDYVADYLENIRDRLVPTLPYVILRILTFHLYGTKFSSENWLCWVNLIRCFN